ncbi:MAG TPA: hypothetical protein VII95_17755 [Terriglobales bacterium]
MEPSFLKTHGGTATPLNFPLPGSLADMFAETKDGQKRGVLAFPEGCPQHPSYGQGHATVASICVTIVKAWF